MNGVCCETPVGRGAQRRRSWTALVRKEHGNAAVEFCLVVPVILVMALATLDLGRGIHANMQIQNAANAGVAYAVSNGFDSGGIVQAVEDGNSFEGIVLTDGPTEFCGCPTGSSIVEATCSVPCTGQNYPGTYVRLTAEGTYRPILRYPFMPETIVLSAAARVRIQ